MIMCIQNLLLIGLFLLKILSKNLILTSIKGLTLLQICRNSNSSKLSCMSLLPARMKKIQLKMKVLECSQDFSHHRSMGIFPDAQRHLTPQSTVRSAQISNSVKTLWLSSLPTTSSPKGNDRSPENKQVFLKSSLVSKRFFSIAQGQPTLPYMVDQILNSIKGCYSVANLQKKMTL